MCVTKVGPNWIDAGTLVRTRSPLPAPAGSQSDAGDTVASLDADLPRRLLRAARAGLPHLPASARDKLAEALTIKNLTFLVAAIAVDLTLAGTPAGAVFNVLIGVRSDHSH